MFDVCYLLPAEIGTQCWQLQKVRFCSVKHVHVTESIINWVPPPKPNLHPKLIITLSVLI